MIPSPPRARIRSVRLRTATAMVAAVAIGVSAGPAALAPQAHAQQGPAVSLIRDTEIEQIVRKDADPILVAAGLEPKNIQIHLVGDKELILERMRSRDHFMPPELLDSQLATLELLEPEEHGLVVDIGDPLEQIVADIARRFAGRV